MRYAALSLSVPSDLDLWRFDLKIFSAVIPDEGKFSSRFERRMVFRFRDNGGHGTDSGRTDERALRVMQPPRGGGA